MLLALAEFTQLPSTKPSMVVMPPHLREVGISFDPIIYMAKKVVIIGAGLAGLSAGLDLQLGGYNVIILEAKGFVGGRTASWNQEGMDVESGLHRILGFYKQLPRLIKRAGLKVKDIVIWEDEIEIKIPNGPSAVYGASLVFKPLKTLSAPFRNHIISWKDTRRLAKFFTSGLKDYILKPKKLDQYSVLEYAKKFKVSDLAIIRILQPLTAGIFFYQPDKYSAYVLFGLLAQAVRRAARIRVGAFKGGMTQVLASPIAEKLKKEGATVLTDMTVDKIEVKDNRVTGAYVKGEFIGADAVILATSIGSAKRIVENSALQTKLKKVIQLPTMPEVNLQVEFTSPVWPVDRTVFCPGTSLITFAEQSRTTFKNKAGRLSIILTPPEELIHLSDEEIYRIFTTQASDLGIDLSKARQYRVVRHPNDFYSLSPGSEKLKPKTKTSFQNLFLAGDYVRQPFLATMEGAVVSGRKAAKAVKKLFT